MSELVDSRHYRFAFAVNDPRDLPSDFGLELRELPEAGLFLPKMDSYWPRKRGSSPMVLLLFEDRLEAIPHPKSGRAEAFRIPLSGLEAVESGGALLLGWIRLCASSVHTLEYNRRNWKPVAGFLRALRGRLCGRAASGAGVEPDAGIEMKFRIALTSEMDPGEKPVAIVNRPAAERVVRRWIFRFRRVEPGHLLALFENRLLWLNDSVDGAYDRYGCVAAYAPLGQVAGVSLEDGEVALRLRSGRMWRVPVEGEEAARGFVEHWEEMTAAAGNRRAGSRSAAKPLLNDV